MKIDFTINNIPQQLEVDENMPLLWVLRDELGLKGTKYGCGVGMCGACTVIVDNEAIRSCSYPVYMVHGKAINTIENHNEFNKTITVVQKAWETEIVPQCGYCQPGFMMATAHLLSKIPNPTDQEIEENITNICRCGTYTRMRKAIHLAASIQKKNRQ